MLQIGYLIICEDVEANKKNLNIRNPLSAITPINLPGNYSFKVAFSLHNFNEESFGDENVIRITLVDPNERVLVDTGKLKIKTDEKERADKPSLEAAEADVTMNNVEFHTKGLHKLTLSVNSEEKELSIPVLRKRINGVE